MNAAGLYVTNPRSPAVLLSTSLGLSIIMRAYTGSAAYLLGLLLALPAAAQNLPVAVVTYLNKQGPIENVVFFRGRYPSHQIVVRYCINEGLPGGKLEGANNATAFHCNVVLFNRTKKGQWSFGDQIEIGQGTVQDFDSGYLSGESVAYIPSDALCCPSKKTPFRFATTSGRFVNAPE